MALALANCLRPSVDATDKLSDLRVNFPAAWFDIKDRLAGMSESYISFEKLSGYLRKPRGGRGSGAGAVGRISSIHLE